MGRTNVRTKDLTSRPRVQIQARFHNQRWRGRDTPLKTSAKRGKFRRLCSRPCRTVSRVLSPINESESFNERSVRPSTHNTDRLLRSNSTPSTVTYSPEESSDAALPAGVSFFLSDCDDSSSSMDTSSCTSLFSPEVFRREEVLEEPVMFPSLGEPEELQVKNSTLLDLSYAEDINMQQPPNLSSIIDFSEVHDDRDPENRYPSGTDPAAGSTEEKLLNVSIERTPLPCGYSAPPVPTKIPRQGKIRTIRCRKKVTFNSCVLLEMPHDGLATPPANQGTGNPGVNCDGIVPREDVKNLTLTPAFPTTPEQAKFFDFADKEERDAFFQRLCQRFSFEFPFKLIT
ncbi:uncharacterized protein LOC134013621 isoform X1 [Osmerus eperlanus]|uniref:uncharacterized protein LOC134013621 isoform X1 n=1 Tax=Osmerus eperlanus TaxID=29151 RepID=UPI002E1580DA